MSAYKKEIRIRYLIFDLSGHSWRMRFNHGVFEIEHFVAALFIHFKHAGDRDLIPVFRIVVRLDIAVIENELQTLRAALRRVLDNTGVINFVFRSFITCVHAEDPDRFAVILIRADHHVIDF